MRRRSLSPVGRGGLGSRRERVPSGRGQQQAPSSPRMPSSPEASVEAPTGPEGVWHPGMGDHRTGVASGVGGVITAEAAAPKDPSDRPRARWSRGEGGLRRRATRGARRGLGGPGMEPGLSPGWSVLLPGAILGARSGGACGGRRRCCCAVPYGERDIERGGERGGERSPVDGVKLEGASFFVWVSGGGREGGSRSSLGIDLVPPRSSPGAVSGATAPLPSRTTCRRRFSLRMLRPWRASVAEEELAPSGRSGPIGCRALAPGLCSLAGVCRLACPRGCSRSARRASKLARSEPPGLFSRFSAFTTGGRDSGAVARTFLGNFVFGQGLWGQAGSREGIKQAPAPHSLRALPGTVSAPYWRVVR